MVVSFITSFFLVGHCINLGGVRFDASMAHHEA
jgi:hypothetical protein